MISWTLEIRKKETIGRCAYQFTDGHGEPAYNGLTQNENILF